MAPTFGVSLAVVIHVLLEAEVRLYQPLVGGAEKHQLCERQSVCGPVPLKLIVTVTRCWYRLRTAKKSGRCAFLQLLRHTNQNRVCASMCGNLTLSSHVGGSVPIHTAPPSDFL